MQPEVHQVRCRYTDYNGDVANAYANDQNPADVVLTNLGFGDQFVTCSVLSASGASNKDLYVPKGTIDEVKEYSIGEWK